MTLDEFLIWEERQEDRWEFDGSRPIARDSGTIAHATVQGNLTAAIVGRLRGTPCRCFGGGLKIEVAGSIRYPDGFVVCSPQPVRGTVVRDPVVIFEVLSPSTSGTDRFIKNEEYAATPEDDRRD